MSEHHQFFFPLQPHLPPPDWQALEARLRQGNYVLEPRGAGIPRAALVDFSLLLARGLQQPYQYREGMRTAGDVIDLYRQAGYLPASVPVRHDDTLEETHALLAAHGIEADRELVDDESSDWHSPRYCLGPAARHALCPLLREQYDADPQSLELMLLAYDEPNPRVAVGENLEAPSVPGSDEPLEDMPPFGSHIDFIGAAYEDPAVQWRNPRDGRDYRILDLDWHYSFAMGFRLIRARGLDPDSAEGLAAVLSGLVGQPMGCSHRHL